MHTDTTQYNHSLPPVEQAIAELLATEIDRILLEEMNATARTMAVTDTTALEAKRAERKKAANSSAGILSWKACLSVKRET